MAGKRGNRSRPRRPDADAPRCAVVSLGCPKNLIDTERMLGLLRREGYTLATRPEGADLVIVNTCGFLDLARQESIEAIQEMVQLKKAGRVGRVVVAGCMAQRDGAALLETCPGVDDVLGVFARDEIARVVARPPATDGRRVLLRPRPESPPDDTDRLRVTPRHMAYLRIAEGCDRACAFCSIPMLRGHYASKPIDRIVAEARQLADDGARELVLVAQDTSYYGRDLPDRPRLAELLARLEAIEPLRWIRLMYLYPQNLDDDLVETVAAGGKVLPYLDIPLQHVNDEVLRRMRRGVTRQQTEELLDRLRGRIPGLVLRTTLLAGFPGETPEQFEELLDFVRRRRFERLGVFPYRFEPGTASAEMEGHLDEEVRQARAEALMQAQQEVAFAWAAAQVGRTWDVLVDRDIPGQSDAYVGRTWADAPDVDAVVYVTGRGLRPGQIVPCEMVATEGYDLVGVALAPHEESHG
ncbi:MAG: 30S ribosomal protein S12 methylthiotransferase RimO [Pirellulales bacterium]|nr:30S ribosomal protein S12 methylthiotransferase RimO [Pirellulales bacterium]